MNAGRDVGLVIVGCGQWHIGHVENEVSDVPEELVLVNVPRNKSQHGNCQASDMGVLEELPLLSSSVQTR